MVVDPALDSLYSGVRHCLVGYLDVLRTYFYSMLARLFEILPLVSAMPSLTPKAIAKVNIQPLLKEVANKPALLAGLLLYIDDLQGSHHVSQNLHNQTGSYWHAIMHRREGDFWNSKYWLRLTGQHPATQRTQNFDAVIFFDAVANSASDTDQTLLELQRIEWLDLFEWCLENDPA